jgi:hypothetical protein
MLLTRAQALRFEGSISEGTLRDEDVGGALVTLLDSIGEELSLGKTTDSPDFTMACVRWNGRKDKLLGEWERLSDPDSDCDFVGELVSEMFDLVNEALPAGFACESSEGDGASFGVWQVELIPEEGESA